MADLPQATRTLQALHRLGVQSSQDDFGTGHATLSHLKALPVDELESDRTFVSGLDTSASDTQIVSAVTGLADAFDLRVVAEGIEHAHQVPTLRRLGCAYGQGYHFGRPSPDLAASPVP
jgi:EAL domain-containing protein (putative c-di-GMP-specific phosphodiesterase class I)